MEEEKQDKRRFPCFDGEVSPWLLFTHGPSKHKQVQTFHKICSTSSTWHLKSIPQLRHKAILASINGWLILRDLLQLDIFTIFNPFTLHNVVLPPLQAPNDNDNITCGLKSSPDSPGCLLLLCFTEHNIMYSCRPSLLDCCWITQPIHLPGLDSDSISNSNSSIISHTFTVNGVMYVTTCDVFSNQILYSVDDSNPRSLILNPLQLLYSPDFSSPRRGFWHDYYIESCDRLYCVMVASYYVELLDVEYVKVFELDFVECRWRGVKSLNGRSFFVGSDCCTWCWGTTNQFGIQRGITRNSIYISRPGAPHPLHIYYLQDGSLLPLGLCPNLLSPHDHPVWLIPQHLKLKQEFEEININQERATGRIEYKKPIEMMSRFNELPLDIVEKVSKHMQLFDYWNFRATSKTFRSICPALPLWETNNMVPLFLFFDHGGSCELLDPCCRHNSRSHVVPFFQDPYVIRFSKNGWILALVGTSLQYFNIINGVRGEYPDPPVRKELYLFFMSIAFSTYPTCSECLTIATLGSDNDFIILYHESGKETWIVCPIEVEDGEIAFDPSNSCPIFVAGAFYILDQQGYLGMFQLVNGKTSWKIYPKPQNLNKFNASHLVESEGELYSVFIENMGQWVQVFRFDKLKKIWVEVQYLENHVLFISRASSFSIVTRDCRMRNRIYFPRLYKQSVVFYSQDTRKYHSLASDDIIEDFYGSSEPLHCCWIY